MKKFPSKISCSLLLLPLLPVLPVQEVELEDVWVSEAARLLQEVPEERSPSDIYRIAMLIIINPILDTRISFVLLLLLLLRHAQGTPPGFRNGLDWRALVESCPPNIGKLRG